MIIKNRDIIIVGIQAWDTEIGSNCKNIALEMAKHNRVLYINMPISRITIKREKGNALIQKRIDIIENKKADLALVSDNIWNLTPACFVESVNWMPFTTLFKILNKINNKRIAKEIKKAINKLHFKEYILFNDSDMFLGFHLKEMLRPALSVYYTRDNLMGVPYWYKHGHKMEPQLFAKSDVVVANSTYLAGIARQYNPHSYYVGQGCETENFDLDKIEAIPPDVASINSPVIGYIGALFKLRLNLDLLEQLAAGKKEWNFVFVGPEDEPFKNSSLHQLPNVYFLGLKDSQKLPSYLAKFDVAINPQVVNEVTIGNYPRKIDEYLAMGKPTVATGTKAMGIFADYVYFAATTDEYIQQIEKALNENNTEKENARIAFARSHTWENSVAEIYDAMLKVKPALASDVYAYQADRP